MFGPPDGKVKVDSSWYTAGLVEITDAIILSGLKKRWQAVVRPARQEYITIKGVLQDIDNANREPVIISKEEVFDPFELSNQAAAKAPGISESAIGQISDGTSRGSVDVPISV